MCIIFDCDKNFKIHMLCGITENFTILQVWRIYDQVIHFVYQYLYICPFCFFFLSIRISSSFIKWNKALFYPYFLQSLVTMLLQTGTCLGEATIRFLPKLRSLRPIANLGRQPPATAKSVIFVSKTLYFNLTS